MRPSPEHYAEIAQWSDDVLEAKFAMLVEQLTQE